MTRHDSLLEANVGVDEESGAEECVKSRVERARCKGSDGQRDEGSGHQPGCFGQYVLPQPRLLTFVCEYLSKDQW